MIAVASGKGGTGKTTIAVHLALAGDTFGRVLLVDLDVEAPDSMGYFPGAEADEAPLPVLVSVPRLVEARCTGCGLCARSCRFGAIVAIGGVVTIDEKACKGCGRCVAICPCAALVEAEIPVGQTLRLSSGRLGHLEGRLAVGDIRSTSVIEATKKRAADIGWKTGVGLEVRDCPPGVSCPATHALEGSHYLILVAEPTAFSLHDLGAALRLAASRKMPVGVVINKEGFGSADVAGLAARHGAPIIGRIPFLRSRAESGAAARLWTDDRDFMGEMRRILATAVEGARTEAGT